MTVRAAKPMALGQQLWSEERAREYERAGAWTGRSLTDDILWWVENTPDHVALIDGDVRLTYSQLWTRVEAAIDRLRELGLCPGDTVVSQFPNSWHFVVTLLACMHGGLHPVMALPSHRTSEIRSLALRADARLLLIPGDDADFDHVAMARELIADPGVNVSMMVVLNGSGATVDGLTADQLCAEPPTAATFRPAVAGGTDVAVFLCSGGSTGQPKLIPRTHNDYGYMARTSAQICGVGRDTVHLAVLPLGHGYPMSGPGILGTLMTGGQVVVLATPSPAAAFAAIEEHRVTMTSLVPAVVHRWIEHESDCDLSSLTLVQSAAGRLPRHLAEQLGPRLGGAALQQVYGMSEGLLCLTRPGDGIDHVLSCQGAPISDLDQVAIEVADGELQSAGFGVLVTRGPYTPGAYFQGTSSDNRAHLADGWYRTGDIVQLRPDKTVVVMGRDKDVVNRGGEKIWAEEVEALVGSMLTVAECAVIAEPDEVLGERICAYLVTHGDRIVSLDEVVDHLVQQRVAPFKFPERIINVAALPLQSVGKIDKTALRHDLYGRLGLPTEQPHARGA